MTHVFNYWTREQLRLVAIPDLTKSNKNRGPSPFTGLLKVNWFFPPPFFSINPREATWIMNVGLPVYLCNAMPAGLHPALGLRDFAALGVYAGSFLFEVISDRQKAAWRRAKDAKEHDEQFITSGLWSISRHPKYVYITFY